jgi:hypothetical protein
VALWCKWISPVRVPIYKPGNTRFDMPRLIQAFAWPCMHMTWTASRWIWCGRCPLISVGFIKRNVLYVEQSWQFFLAEFQFQKQVKVTTCPHISKPSKALRSFVRSHPSHKDCITKYLQSTSASSRSLASSASGFWGLRRIIFPKVFLLMWNAPFIFFFWRSK